MRDMKRWLGLAGRIVPLVLAVVVLYVLELSQTVALPHQQRRVEEVEKGATRLVIIWIDSLADEDVLETDRMPKLKEHLGLGLNGRVRSCADGLSVACFTAMQTGVDRFSLFSMMRNFGGAEQGVPPGSVMRVLQEDGYRLGYVGDNELRSTVTGFDFLDIAPEETTRNYTVIARGFDLLDSEQLDFLVIHVDQTDMAGHKDGPNSEEYVGELRRVDDEIEKARSRLRPTDHLVVMGDHGHDAQGRHFAGLWVPTFAAFWGPVFGRSLHHPMASTDFAALWGRVFGYEYSWAGWVSDYFEGEPLEAPSELPQLNTGEIEVSSAAAIVALVLALIIALPSAGRWRWLVASGPGRTLLFVGLLVSASALVAGMTFSELRPLIYYKGTWFNRGFGLVAGLTGAVLLVPSLVSWRLVRAERHSHAFTVLVAVGAFLVALPTVYKFGGTHAAVTGLLVMLSSVPIFDRRRRAALLPPLAALVGVLYTLWNPWVKSFRVWEFSLYQKTLAAYTTELTLALVVVALAMTAWRREGGWRPRWLIGGALGLVLALVGPNLPPKAYILPCMLSLPVVLIAHRFEWADGIALAVCLPALAFFFGFDTRSLAPIAAAFVLWPLWAWARAEAPPLELGVTVLVFLWLALCVSLGNRMSGIDFQYFFEWLDVGERVEQSWIRNGLLTTAKYTTPPLLGMLMARRIAPEALTTAVPLAWFLGKLKVTATLVFIVGFVGVSGGAGPFVTSDVLQEAGVFVLVLFLLLGLPMSRAIESGAAHAAHRVMD